VATPAPPVPLAGSRALFTLDPTWSHLNHGSFGTVPRPVQEAQRRLHDEIEANPTRFYGGGALPDRIGRARELLATTVGLDPARCAFVPNATSGVSVVLDSIPFEPGDEIVRTDHAYGSVSMAVDRIAQESGAIVRVVALPLSPSDDEVVAGVLAEITDRTRLVVLDFVTSPTAHVMPVEAVHAALRKRGIPLLVDAAHGPGLAVHPPVGDFWVGNLHKWAFAPRPTALLSVAPEWQDAIRPGVVSWRHAEGYPFRLEASGTGNPTPWLAAPVGAQLLRDFGLETVIAHNDALAQYGQHVVGAALGLTPADLPEPGGGLPLPMRLVPLPRELVPTPEAAGVLGARILDDLRTHVAMTSFGDQTLLRLSAQIYNRAEEYERLADRLPGILPS
jgi:isopenicillin-N epimerase